MKKLFLLLAVIMTTALSAMAQTQTASGVVCDAATGEPLVGATVQPIGGGNGVATDIDGKFTLHLPASATQLQVSYIGYNPQRVAIGTNLEINLEPSANALDEVIVTGYGSGKRLGSLVGSVSVVGEQTLEDTPSSNFVDALQGQVPGLTIFSNSGEPSSVPSSIRIRGVNSLNASNTPLFILDGAPVTSAVFTTINPSDIESVTVLKDASSTAIYGSRAANGVIVITTKKGRYGEQATVTVRANVGWSELARQGVKLMNSQQRIEYGDKIGNPVSQEVRDLVNNYGISTDWRDELIKDHALMYSLEGRVSGGTDRTRYYLSLGHYDQDGLVALSGLRRETMSTNLDTKVNDWFQVGLSGNFGYEQYMTNSYATSRHGANPFNSAEILLPWDTPYYYSFDDNGNMVRGEEAMYYHYSQNYNPNWMSEVYNGHDRSSNLTVMMNLYEQLTPVKGLTIRAQQAVNAFDYTGQGVIVAKDLKGVTPMGDSYNLSTLGSSSAQAFQRWYRFTYTNTAEYRTTIAEQHHAAILLGQESIIERNRNFSVSSSGQPSYQQWLLNQGTDVTISGLTHSESKTVINSWFANLTYDYANKYFLDFNIRRDGSSKFAPGHRWSTFYAIGGMWDAKQENFLADIKWIDNLKFRVNYGTTGNSGISNYAYQGTAGSGRPYNGSNSLGLSQQSNEDLTWETVKAFDFGLDFNFLDRFRVSADFYTKTTEDMLMDIPYDYTTGYDEGIANIGSMRNTGVDVNVGIDFFKNSDWYVGMTANFGYNDVKVTELFNGLDKFTLPGTGTTYEVDKNPFSLYAVRYAGVDPADGQQRWYTKDGNITKVYSDDDEVDLGKNCIAPWNGGFGIQVRWKNLMLNTDFNWSAEKYIFNANYWYTRTVAQTLNCNGSVDLLNVWTQPGDKTNIPNQTDLYGISQEVRADSRFIENASFLRLKNLTLTYSLPSKWLQTVSLKEASVHFTTRNLFTITAFNGSDPEYEGNVVSFLYPNTRQFEFGIDVTF